jgi:hypothetical protein
MADYYPIIARAIAGLNENSAGNRAKLYEKCRDILIQQLRDVAPSLPETNITRERRLLEEAFKKVEALSPRPPARERFGYPPAVRRLHWLKKEYEQNRGHMNQYRERLGVASDDPETIADELCRRLFDSKLFVSHTGDDARWCLDTVTPVIEKRYGSHSYFFMSLKIDGSSANVYRVLVEYSLFWAKTIVIALSKHSLDSDWVRLEARWAVDQYHPILVCLMDDTSPAQLHAKLADDWRLDGRPSVRFIDFRRDIQGVQALLDELLQAAEFAPLFFHDDLKININLVRANRLNYE